MRLGKVRSKLQTLAAVNFSGSRAGSAWLTAMAEKPIDQVTLRMLEEHTPRKAHEPLL